MGRRGEEGVWGERGERCEIWEGRRTGVPHGEVGRQRKGRNTGERDEKKRCPAEVSSSGIIQTEREGEGDLIHSPFTQASAHTRSLSVLDSFFWTLSPPICPSFPPSLFLFFRHEPCVIKQLGGAADRETKRTQELMA